MPTTAGRIRPGIVVHRVTHLPALDTRSFYGIPTTTVARVLLDLGPRLTPPELSRACHEAWVRHRTSPAEVERCIARNPSKKGGIDDLMSMAHVHGNLVPMRIIAAGEFKQTCLRLLDEVGVSGEPILITKRGKPVAQLTPVAAERQEDWAGALRERGSISGDLVAPAAAPDEWEALRS